MAKPEIPSIEGRRVLLRPLTHEDLPRTLEWRNSDAIRKWFFTSDIITIEQHRKWFDAYLARNDDFIFVIEEKTFLRDSVGQLSLYNIDWERKQAEFGRLMIGNPLAQGQGLAKEATELLIDFAEKHWGIQEIYLDVYMDNLPAIALYGACGFSTTRIERNVVHMSRNAHVAK